MIAIDLIQQYETSSEDEVAISSCENININNLDEKFSNQSDVADLSDECYDENYPQNVATVESSGIESTERNIQLVSITSSSEGLAGKLTRKLSKQETVRNSKRKSRASSRGVIEKNCKCRMRCGEKISKDQRSALNNRYWSSGYIEQRAIILQHVDEVQIKRRRANTDGVPVKSRTFEYNIMDEQNIKIQVCQGYFLNTLGYEHSCTYVIYRCFDKSEDDVLLPDRRGKKTKENKIREDMKEDIFSYHPTISHYRREHAPNVLYLPSDITITGMFKSWKEKREEAQLGYGSYTVYGEVVRENRIRFTRLGNEECEDCIEFEQHEKTSGHNRTALILENIACDACKNWLSHKERAKTARQLYQQDKEKTNDQITVSADLEKVSKLSHTHNYKYLH